MYIYGCVCVRKYTYRHVHMYIYIYMCIFLGANEDLVALSLCSVSAQRGTATIKNNN